MAQFNRGAEVTTNGTSAVELEAGPSSGRKAVENANGFNLDDADCTFVLQLDDNTVTRELGRTLVKAGQGAPLNGLPVVLTAATDSLEVKLLGAHTTTAPRARATQIFEEP